MGAIFPIILVKAEEGEPRRAESQNEGGNNEKGIAARPPPVLAPR